MEIASGYTTHVPFFHKKHALASVQLYHVVNYLSVLYSYIGLTLCSVNTPLCLSLKNNCHPASDIVCLILVP